MTAERIEALEAAAAQPSREAALVDVVRETYKTLYAEYGPREDIVIDLRIALERYDTPAKDERREEAK